MKAFFNTIPQNINCDEKDREKIEALLAVTPRELLSPSVIAAIQNGEPIGIASVKTDANYRNAQDPQVQKCFNGRHLQYIVLKEQADDEKKVRNHERWMKRYRKRCPMSYGPCSLRNSCDDCPHKDHKEAYVLSIEKMLEDGLDPSDVIETKGTRSKIMNVPDPTAEVALGTLERESLLAYLANAGQLYAREYALDYAGYSHKEIANIVKRSESSVTRDFKAIAKLTNAFYADWNS